MERLNDTPDYTMKYVSQIWSQTRYPSLVIFNDDNKILHEGNLPSSPITESFGTPTPILRDVSVGKGVPVRIIIGTIKSLSL